jgi:hypothetical protein
MGDELDEVQGSVGNTRTVVWDVRDLDDPVVAIEYNAPRQTIDHNMYVRGHLLFQSQYVDGLRILDISDPEAPVEVGYFDTHPDNAGIWEGSWSNYPYMDDNMVAATSSVDGLFILQPASSLTTAVEPAGELPEAVALLNIYPNPFSTESVLELGLTRSESIRIDVLDVLGRSVRTLYEGEVRSGQTLRQYLSGDGLSAGTYIIRVKGESFETTHRLLKAQ